MTYELACSLQLWDDLTTFLLFTPKSEIKTLLTGSQIHKSLMSRVIGSTQVLQLKSARVFSLIVRNSRTHSLRQGFFLCLSYKGSEIENILPSHYFDPQRTWLNFHVLIGVASGNWERVMEIGPELAMIKWTLNTPFQAAMEKKHSFARTWCYEQTKKNRFLHNLTNPRT